MRKANRQPRHAAHWTVIPLACSINEARFEKLRDALRGVPNIHMVTLDGGQLRILYGGIKFSELRSRVSQAALRV